MGETSQQTASPLEIVQSYRRIEHLIPAHLSPPCFRSANQGS